MIPNYRENQKLSCDYAGRAVKRARILSTIALAFILGLAITPTAQAQTYQVIYNFTGGADGAYPSTGLTIDGPGNIYGTAFGGGGAQKFGTVFNLDNDGGGWSLAPIYAFQAGSDGAGPISALVIGPDGALYGSTSAGGGGPCVSGSGYHGCGTVYSLRPPSQAPATVLYNWSSTILHRFSITDGSYPQGALTFDSSGNIYGTTVNGGDAGWGVIYKLTPSGGGWTQDILYQAQGNGDGASPMGGIVFDQSGNLYGVFTQNGPNNNGAVYELSPSGSGWRESTVHSFTYHGTDGSTPQGGPIFDNAGNLYGSTVHDVNGGGTVFEMERSGGGWSYNFLYGLSGGIDLGPYDKLTMDAAGNLYGTTYADGQYGYGSVFKLTRSSGGWTYASLHDFTGGRDGANPICQLVFDSSGNLYGTATNGGTKNMGVVFEITP